MAAQNKQYDLYEDAVRVSATRVAAMYREMVATMTAGTCHIAIRDIDLGTHNFRIPAGMNVFLRRNPTENNVLMFGHIGRDPVCRMLYTKTVHNVPHVFTFTDSSDPLNADHANWVRAFKANVTIQGILDAIARDQALVAPQQPEDAGGGGGGDDGDDGGADAGNSRGRGGAAVTGQPPPAQPPPAQPPPAQTPPVQRRERSPGHVVLHNLSDKQWEFCPKLLKELDRTGKKTIHCAWWVFPTERYGDSEEEPKTRVTPQTASELVYLAPSSWRKCLEKIVSLANAPLTGKTSPRGLAAVLPAADLPRVQYFVKFWRAQECCPDWLHDVCRGLDTKAGGGRSFSFGGGASGRGAAPLNPITEEKAVEPQQTPLQMSRRKPFRPSYVLLQAGIVGSDEMLPGELIEKLTDKTMLTPEYGIADVLWGRYTNGEGGVRYGLLASNGWVCSNTMTGLLFRMASEFGACTFESTADEVRSHFRKCDASGRETFLLLDSVAFLTGAKILSPRGSRNVDSHFPDTAPPSSGVHELLDLTQSPPPELLDLTYSPPAEEGGSVPVVETNHRKSIVGGIYRFMDVFAFDNILIPINCGNAHWILGRIHTRTHETLIYDPFGGARNTKLQDMQKFRDDLYQKKRDVIDRLTSPRTGELLSESEKATFLDMHAIWDDNDNYTTTEGYDKQRDSVSCGVFVMTYIAYLLTQNEDKIKADVTQDNCANVFRLWLTRMLCEEAVHADPE